MIRKPIGRVPRILLGIVSFCALIGAYTLLANIQYWRNPTQHTTPGWTKHQQVRIVDKSLATAKTELEQAVVSVPPQDKERATELAERLAAMGFKTIAPEDLTGSLAEAGVETKTVNKLADTKTDASVFLSIPTGETAGTDEGRIRSAVAEQGTPYVTRIKTDEAIVFAVELNQDVVDAKSVVSRLENAKQQIDDGYFKSLLGGFRLMLFGESDADAGFVERFKEGTLYAHFGVSLKRFVLGMLVGISLAFVTGIAMGCFTPVEALLLPPLSFLASIPPTAMMVVYMLIFKLEPFVAVVGIGIFPVLAQAIYQAVKNDVPESSVSKAYTLGASNFEVIWEVVIPQIMPRIIDAIRLQIGPAMIFLIAVEWAIGSEGIGYRIRLDPKGGYYNLVYLALIVLGAFGMLLDWAMIGFRRWWCPWFGDSR